MSFSQLSSKKWSEMVPPPRLDDKQWNNLTVLGLVFLAMAATQAIGFNEFKGWISEINMTHETTWAAGIILAEVWAALSFLKIRLSSAFRLVGHCLALGAAGFWFIENLRLISDGTSTALTNSGYFGKYLAQTPGWWTVVEATVLLLWTLYAVDLLKNKN